MEIRAALLRAATSIGLCLTAGLAAAGAQQPAADYEKVIREIRPRVVQWMAGGGVPGLAVALVDDQRTIWAEGFGRTDLDSWRPVASDTPFGVASVSKTVTATAILFAVQDGLLDLDAPITRYLPWFTVRSRFEPQPERRITLRHLLSHTAGLTSDAPLGNNYDENRSSFQDHVRSICTTWLRFRVGERFSYSNMGLDLAGYALEAASGRPFAQYVHERMFVPLGMAKSAYDGARPHLGDRASGHTGDLEAVAQEIPLIPAGALQTTADDMARFVRFHLGGGTIDGRRLLDPGLLRAMSSIPFPVAGQDEGYALAIDRRHSRGTEVLSHSGRGYGFEAYVVWYPEERIGAVALSNATSGWVHIVLARELLDRILDARGRARNVPAAASPGREPVVRPPLSELRQLEGRYVNERAGDKKVVLADQLLGFEAGGSFQPFTFHGPRDLVVQEAGQTMRYRFVDQPSGCAALVRVNDGTFFDYNTGPLEARGPGGRAWRDFLGTYRIRMLGKDQQTKRVHVVDGHLFIDELRAEEHEPGLFFESTGEALDFRTQPPTWGNIKLYRQPAASLPRAELLRLVGDYDAGAGRIIRVRLDGGRLAAEATGEVPWSLHTHALGRKPREPRRDAVVESFFAALRDGRFVAARQDFDDSLKEQAALSEAGLRETWTATQKRNGAFRGAELYDADRAHVRAAASFEKGLVDFVFRFDLDGRIAYVSIGEDDGGRLPARLRLRAVTPSEFVVDGFEYRDADGTPRGDLSLLFEGERGRVTGLLVRDRRQYLAARVGPRGPKRKDRKRKDS